MPNQPKRPHVTFRADADLIAKARRKAKRQGTNLSEVMRIKLEAYVYDEPWPREEEFTLSEGDDEPDEVEG